jgi:hypothetical protein
MTPDDFSRDPRLADVLREFDRANERTGKDLGQLARRIKRHAHPLLAARTVAPEPWWVFAATWSRPLLSVGALTAVIAVALIAWSSRNPVEAAMASDTQVLLNSLVAPIEQHVVKAANE